MRPLIEARIEHTMKLVIDSAPDDSHAHRQLTAQLLKSNKSAIQHFCKRYVAEHRDKYELGESLNVLAIVETFDDSIWNSMTRVITSEDVAISYKRAALHVIACHADSVNFKALEQLMDSLPTSLAVSISVSLQLNLPKVRVENRFRLLNLSLRIGSTKDSDERRIFGGSVIVAAGVNEECYLDALKRIAEPHSRVLLMLGLYRLNGQRYGHFLNEMKRLAASDSLAKWYFDKHSHMSER